MAEEAENTEQQGMGFGITTETKDSNNVRMLPPIKKEPNVLFPSGWVFPTAKLVNVIAKDNYETKNGDTQVLQFVFKDKEGRQHIHTEWAQDPSDDKYKTKMDGLNSRIKHLYVQYFAEFPKGGIGTKAKNFLDYFTQIQDAFKVNEEIHKVPVFLKLTYYNGNLGFPLSPNFIQRAIKDQSCKLEVNTKYDDVTNKASGGAAGLPAMPGQGAGDAGSDDIDFDADYS